MPAYGRFRRASVSPSPDGPGGHRPVQGHCVRPAVARQVQSAGRLAGRRPQPARADRSGTRIGTTGLERKVAKNGDVLFVTHRGGVRIAEYVQIGPNVVIDRDLSADSDTIIGKYTAIGALSHISHGVKLGDRVFAAVNNLVCGSAVIGDDVWLGPGAVVTNAVSIGSNARVEIASTALKNVEDSGRVFGIKVFGRQWVGNTSS